MHVIFLGIIFVISNYQPKFDQLFLKMIIFKTLINSKLPNCPNDLRFFFIKRSFCRIYLKDFVLGTLPTAEILSDKNVQAWLSMILYLKK